MSLNKLTSKILDFRALDLSHVSNIYDYGSQEIVSRYIGWPKFTSESMAHDYVVELMARVSKNTHMYASVFEKGHSKQIGTIMLFNFDDQAKKAEVGYVFSNDVWSKGYCTETLKQITTFAFETLKLHKLHAQVTAANIGSSRVLEKSGFILEGRLKDHYLIDGQYHDCLLYGLIAK